MTDGAAIVLRKGEEADKTRPLPAAPVWDPGATPASFAVVPEGTPAGVGVAWTRRA